MTDQERADYEAKLIQMGDDHLLDRLQYLAEQKMTNPFRHHREKTEMVRAEIRHRIDA